MAAPRVSTEELAASLVECDGHIDSSEFVGADQRACWDEIECIARALIELNAAGPEIRKQGPRWLLRRVTGFASTARGEVPKLPRDLQTAEANAKTAFKRCFYSIGIVRQTLTRLNEVSEGETRPNEAELRTKCLNLLPHIVKALVGKGSHARRRSLHPEEIQRVLTMIVRMQELELISAELLAELRRRLPDIQQQRAHFAQGTFSTEETAAFPGMHLQRAPSFPAWIIATEEAPAPAARRRVSAAALRARDAARAKLLATKPKIPNIRWQETLDAAEYELQQPVQIPPEERDNYPPKKLAEAIIAQMCWFMKNGVGKGSLKFKELEK
eukprot:14142-Heterococcus_DN1.PRE.5